MDEKQGALVMASPIPLSETNGYLFTRSFQGESFETIKCSEFS